jgi:hypothetical protein
MNRLGKWFWWMDRDDPRFRGNPTGAPSTLPAPRMIASKVNGSGNGKAINARGIS